MFSNLDLQDLHLCLLDTKSSVGYNYRDFFFIHLSSLVYPTEAFAGL